MRFGRWIATGCVFGLSMVVALLIGELMVRHLAPQKLYRFPGGMFESHPTLQYRLAPHFVGVSNTVEFKTRVRTNGLGLRAKREYGRPGPATFRLLVLGDSFTMGVRVEQDETYGQVLARRLTNGERSPTQSPAQPPAPIDKDYEVINAGVPGYNTQQALTYLRESGLALDPDLVVLGFYIGNDITENFAAPSISVRDGYLQSGEASDGVLPAWLRRYLALNSHLYQLLWPYQRWLVDRSLWVRTEQERLRRRLAIYAPTSNGPDDSDFVALWEATRRQLAAMADIARERGVRVAVVVIPELVQVDAQQWQSTIRAVASGEETYRTHWPNQRVVALCRELGLPVLDLLPVLAQAPPGEPLYFKLDGHWTRRGHEVAAVAIDAFLRREHLVPAGG